MIFGIKKKQKLWVKKGLSKNYWWEKIGKITGQMWSGQMSPIELWPVKGGLRKLTLKFGQIQMSNSPDNVVIEFVVVGGCVGGGLQGYVHVKPNLG